MPSFVRRVKGLSAMLCAGFLTAGLSGCDSVTGPESELSGARAQWADAAPANYAFTLSRSCFCAYEEASPVVVTVRGGAVESRHYSTTTGPVSPAFFDDFPGIDGLFSLVETAIRDADRMEVRYHATLGYPEEIRIFWLDNALDDFLTILVTDFAVR